MLSRRLVLLTAVITANLFISACSSTPSANSQDPWEGFNRSIFAFNDTADRWIVKPVAVGYTKITPDPMEQGFTNFFDNLLEIRNVLNDVLQWKWGQAGNDFGRLLVNSTLGVAGIFDVAKHVSLPKSEGEDFGQTLAVWGVGQGPYLVLPFLGPSSVRDTSALPVDWSVGLTTYIDHVPTRNSTIAFDFIQQRAGLLDVEDLVSGDKYVFFREAYLQRRNYLIKDGEIEDDFGDEDF
jgi:phospholipid-binding lipoprotein MlaA